MKTLVKTYLFDSTETEFISSCNVKLLLFSEIIKNA